MSTTQSKKSALVTKAADSEIANDMHPFLHIYKDGRVERLVSSTFVPASEAPGATGVATSDVVIDPGTGVSARIFLNVAAVATGRRLPLIVYFHGGAFCTGSAFSKLFHRHAASLSARAEALVVSVDYRLASEHPIPTAYDDAWMALRWVSSLSDPWLADHADPMGMFIAGESAGANIVHNVTARAATPDGDDLDIEGLIFLQPFFWGPERLPYEEMDRHKGHMFAPVRVDIIWPFPTAGKAGNDDPRLNPPADDVASLPCRRSLVSVASKDVMWDRGLRYAACLGHEEWCREVTLVESEGEDHGFHLYRPARASAVALMDTVVKFINERAPSPNTYAKTQLFDDPYVGTKKTCRASLANGSDKKVCGRPRSMARNTLVIGCAKPLATIFELMLRGYSSKLVQKGPFAPAALGRAVATSFL